MDKPSTVDVLIVGAGAAGLTLAIELGRRGVSSRLIDKLHEPFQGSRGKGIQPRSLEIFEDLGIVDRIVSLGGLYPPQREYRADGSYVDSSLFNEQEPTTAEPYPIPIMLPQFITESVMRDRLAELGGAVEFGSELTSLEQNDDGATAQVQRNGREETIHARYVVGADGGRSFVRRVLDVDFPGKTLGVRAVVADISLSGLTRDVWHRFNSEQMDRQIGLCPLAGTDLFQLQAPIPLEGDVDLSAQGLTAMIAERSGRNDICVRSVSWASAFKMSARLADRYRVGRIFLVGDAAHVHPPTGGQGLNTSVQDAYNLGWKLASVLAGANAALLDSYEEERRPIAASVLGLSTGLLDAHKRGDVRRGREVRQLDLGYTGSSLALEQGASDQDLHAGDRVPDASIQRAAGPHARLFELLKGPHWTLLGPASHRDEVRARPGLRIHACGTQGDVSGEIDGGNQVYSLAASRWVLIRPDKYVGAIVQSDDAAELERYLNTVGLGVEHRPHV